SPRMVLPHMPMMAALSAAHLAAILFPSTLRRLYVLRDRDPAGGTVKEVDSPPKQIVEVGFEAGVAERSEKGVEDVCDCGG
ncbi:toprim domain-containing protein, partial [Brucella anthropi]